MATDNNNMNPTSKAEEYLQSRNFLPLSTQECQEYGRLLVAETMEKASDTDVSTETIMKQYPQRDAETEKFVSQNVHKRGGARWMRSILLPQLAKYKAALSASERFRAEDGMSHINEANNLRDELAKYKAELAEAKTNLGITEIQAMNTQTLLTSCETALAESQQENERLKGGLNEMLSLFPSNETMKTLEPDGGDKTIRKYGILNEDLPTQLQIEQWRNLTTPNAE